MTGDALDPALDPTPYDALLLVSFGGPEAPEDVLPFLENVTRGRNIPRERLAQVGEHYHLFGGRSPINDQNRAYLAAVEADLTAHGLRLPVYWGNRNWDPYLADTLQAMERDGVRRAACLVTSAYSSYSGCRQYRENLADAVAEAGVSLRLDRLRHYFNHPGFVEPMVEATTSALAELDEAVRADARLLFVTHSIPTSMNERSGPEGEAYTGQHLEVAAEVARGVAERAGRRHRHELVFCSRSGPPSMPWLEPDVNDRLAELADEAGESAVGVVVVPIGFVSDHMEVIYDLDTEAEETAAKLGVGYARAATAGLDPRFVAMARELLVERAAAERGEEPDRPAVGSWPASWDRCPVGCCPNAAGPRPALCGHD